MSNKQLTILGIIAAVMLTWAILQSYLTRPQSAKSPEEIFLIQGMPVDEVGKIVLGLQEKEVTLLRSGENEFVVANKDNYPADTAKVRELLENCIKIRTSELVTDQKKNHKALGVHTDDPNGPDAVVRFYRRTEEGGNATELITGIVLGDRVQQGSGQYIRRFEKDIVYRAENTPYLNTTAMNYIDNELLKLKKEQIVKVVVKRPEDTYTVTTDPNDNVILVNKPKNRELKKYDTEQVFEALTSLSFSDVQAESEKTKGLKYEVTYQCFLKDATLYVIGLAQKDDKHYIKCQAGYTDKSIETLLRKRQKSEAEIKEGADKLKIYDEAQKFTRQHAPWVYEISSWQAGKMSKKLEDLLEEEKKEEKKDEAKTNPVTKEEPDKTETPPVGPQLPTPEEESKTTVPADPNQ
jgi:hypothetical protein